MLVQNSLILFAEFLLAFSSCQFYTLDFQYFFTLVQYFLPHKLLTLEPFTLLL